MLKMQWLNQGQQQNQQMANNETAPHEVHQVYQTRQRPASSRQFERGSAGVNPNQGFTRSFLRSRQIQKQTGSKFFQDNRIRTCSYVKEKGGDFVAVPFYDKRDNRIYPTKSEWTKGWTNTVHSNKAIEHAGIGMHKTLLTYHPHKQRSRILVQDFIPPYRNSSVVELGDRGARDTKYWVTTYKNHFTGRPRVGNPTHHPGITAYRNRWDRHQISK